MAVIVTRADKGSPLTNTELDSNFTNLNAGLATAAITGGTITGITDLAVADGGTGASDAAGARTNLGLGSIATQASNNVSITGGSVTGITDLAVADGGTGASDATNARANLSAAKSGANSDITSLSGLTTALSVAQGGTGATTSTGSGSVVLAESPALAGTPTAPTAAGGTNTTQIATTAFVTAATSGLLTDPEVTGCIKEDVYTITAGAAFEIDPGNGSVQLITLGASRTPKATNFAAGESVTLMVLDGSAYTITWTDSTFGGSGVVWVGGTAPTLDTTKQTIIQLWKVGTQVYGMSPGAA